MYSRMRIILGLLTLNVNNVTQQADPQLAGLLRKHENLFQGTGNLKGVEVKLEKDETVPPVAQPARRIPHSMTSKVNDKLKEMRDEGIIEKVEGATPWLSPLIVIPKKTGDVRLVLNMRVPTRPWSAEDFKFQQSMKYCAEWEEPQYLTK